MNILFHKYNLFHNFDNSTQFNKSIKHKIDFITNLSFLLFFNVNLNFQKISFFIDNARLFNQF